jgi:hypothetical protein
MSATGTFDCSRRIIAALSTSTGSTKKQLKKILAGIEQALERGQ